MPRFHAYTSKKAPLTGAFFVCISLLLPAPAHSEIASCGPDNIGLRTTIKHVHDGDTLVLTDDRRLRLVGIDTPELARDDRPAQDFAIEARNYVRSLFATSPAVQLHFDQERHDRHGRLLAHAFLADGTNIQQRLLEAGLATTLVVPPNKAYIACYRHAEQQARQKKFRIWKLAKYSPTETTNLSPATRGFRIIQGEIVRVGYSRKSIWLNLAGKVALRIDRKDLHNFDRNIRWQQAETLVHRRVEARGWLHHNQKRDELFMRVRHPAALLFQPEQRS